MGGASGTAGAIGAGGGGGNHLEPVLVPGTVGTSVARYMMARWPELDATAADCTGPENCFSLNFATAPAGPAPKFWEYTYGVPVLGVQKLYEKTGDPDYLAFVKKYVDRYVDANGAINYGRAWPTPAGAPNDPTIQDVIQPSNLLFGLYSATHDARYLTAMTTTRQAFNAIMKNSAGAFWHKPSYPNQQWLDGIYMSEPFLVKYGALYAEQAAPGDAATCFDTATFQIKLLAQKTFDPGTGLYHHAWNGAPDGKWLGLAPPSKVAPLDSWEVSPILWSRSIAWYIAGIVDVLGDLPMGHADRPRLVEIVNSIATGLRNFQDPATGLWFQVIDAMGGSLPAEGGYPGESVAPVPNWLETSASAIFAYSLAKAVRLEVISPDYLTVATTAWQGVKSKIDIAADGTVTIHGTVVGLSVGGTYNAYANADFRSDLSASLPIPAPKETCPATGTLGVSPPPSCKYIYVRDNVPQGFGAVLLAASELEFP
jgi:unsaturated rhamnogalacturonyl hydrolase